jgi:hypothetical protein
LSAKREPVAALTTLRFERATHATAGGALALPVLAPLLLLKSFFGRARIGSIRGRRSQIPEKYNYDDLGRVTEEETLEFNAPPNVRTSHAPVPGKIVYAYNDSIRTKEVLIKKTSLILPEGAKEPEAWNSEDRTITYY